MPKKYFEQQKQNVESQNPDVNIMITILHKYEFESWKVSFFNCQIHFSKNKIQLFQLN